MDWSRGRTLLALVGIVLTIVAKVGTTECPQDYDRMPRTRRLVNADFVLKGKVLELYFDNEKVHKARFQVHCVFKPSVTQRNVSGEIFIANIQDKDCSQSFVRENEELVVGLKELRCVSAPGSDCDFEFYEANPPQSAAFGATVEFTSEVSKTCGLNTLHPPEFCAGEPTTNLCPPVYTSQCVEAPVSKTNILKASATIVFLLAILTFY